MPDIEAEKLTKFDINLLPDELKMMVASFLPDKELLKLRTSSKFHREIVDEILTSKENLPLLLEKLSHDQLISFIKTYEKMYGEKFVDKLFTAQNVEIIYRQLMPGEIVEFMQNYHDLYRSKYDQILLDQLINPAEKLLYFLTKIDREHAFQFTQMYPNLFAAKVQLDSADTFETAIYLLTASNINDIKYTEAKKIFDALGDERNPAMKMKYEQLKSSIGMMYYATRLMQDEETQSYDRKELMNELFNTLSTYVQPYANFKQLDCSGCQFVGHNISSADFSDVNFSGAYFLSMVFNNSTFIHANFNDSKLKSCELTKANLSGANLSGTRLIESDLTEANLSYADLSNAILERCLLTKANLYHANLTNVNLVYVDLNGINLEGANLTGAKIIQLDQIVMKRSAPKALQQELFRIFDKYQDHPQYDLIVEAIANQIKAHVIESMSKYVDLQSTRNLLAAAIDNGLFSRPGKQGAYTQTAPGMFQPAKTAAMKILDSAVEVIDSSLKKENRPPI